MPAGRWNGCTAALLWAVAAVPPAWSAVDLDALWDFSRPVVSEQRFRAALQAAQGDDALVLRTQIARTLGLRREFDAAFRELDAIEPRLAAAGPAARVQAWLERGRVWRSSGQPAKAAPWFEKAFELADRERLEFLAGDALHMQALVAPDLAAAVSLNRRVVAYARNAQEPRARHWAAVALQNIGVSLGQAGRYDEALPALQESREAYERTGRPVNERVARWLVAHALRQLGRLDEALALQRGLEADWAAAGGSDPYVFEELAWLHQARGDVDRAAYYRALAARR